MLGLGSRFAPGVKSIALGCIYWIGGVDTPVINKTALNWRDL